jgi:translation initiation factor 3 subunit E
MSAPAADEATSGTGTGSIEQWDLTATISPYLDRHMIFPLLDYLEKLIEDGSLVPSTGGYSKLAVSEARLALLRPTHMVDYAIDIYKSIHGETMPVVPSEMEEQKAKVLKDLEDLRQRCAPLEKIEDAERVRRILIENRMDWKARFT